MLIRSVRETVHRSRPGPLQSTRRCGLVEHSHPFVQTPNAERRRSRVSGVADCDTPGMSSLARRCVVGARARSKGMFQIIKIAQIAPLYESCPPRFYGGTERVVAYITDELVRHGHEVTLFASGDSRTAARLEAGCEKALRLDGQVKDPLVYHLRMLDRGREAGEEVQHLQFHT